MKLWSGSWEGTVTTVPVEAAVQGKHVQLSLRVTSMGNAMVHEFKVDGRPDDPMTVFYVEGDRLLLTHYCDAGNRPRMAARMSPSAKTVEFDFLDVSGSNQYGHMDHALFTDGDANHHTEDWTFLSATGKPVQAHLELRRVQ